jgi:non-homologous end joining protein Ku
MDEIKHAPAPKRSTVVFTLNFGMVPVRMRLFAPTEDNKILEKHQYVTVDGEDHEIGLKTVPNPDPVPGEPELLIELGDDEIARVTAGTAVDRGDVPIECFIPLDAIGTRYPVTAWYQARPALRQEKRKSVPDPTADKAFVLLMSAMEEKGVACLVRLALRGPAKFAAITPDGRLYMLNYDSEVREEYPWPDVEVPEAHIQGAMNLIDGYGIDTPALPDETGEALTKYVINKAKTGETIEALPEPEDAPDKPEPDYLALLEASVQVAKSAKKAKSNA